MVKRNIALAALVLAASSFVACDDPGETGRSILSVEDFNAGTPVQSDVQFNDGTSSYIPEDIIPVTFHLRPYNGYITGVEHSQVIIEQYTVTWTRTDGGTGTLPTRTESSAILVSWDDDADASIRITSWQDKTGAILLPLVGTANQVAMRADIHFEGREVGTEKDFEAAIAVEVHFADTVNTN